MIYNLEVQCHVNFLNNNQMGWQHQDVGNRGALPPPPVFHSKIKTGKQRENAFQGRSYWKTVTKVKKCYCFSHSRVSRIQKFFLSANYGGWQYFSVFNSPSTLKSISPALLNQLPSTRFSLKEYHQSPESWAYLPSLFCLFFQYFAPKKAYTAIFIQFLVILGKMFVPSSWF